MVMIPVSSSNLIAVGYDGSTLRIQFRSGVYDYVNVPHSVYEGLMNSNSKGSFVHQYLKNRYPTIRIG